MPLNTKVGRCVTKLKGKYGYGKAIGICQHSTKQNYLTGKTMRKKKTRRRKKRSRKKRGGQHSPTWIIQMTPAALSKFKTMIYQNPKYISTADEEAEKIINYFISYAETNSSINHWVMMTYDNGHWFPGQQPNYDKSVLECSRPCYKVDSAGIKPVLKRTSSRGGIKKKKGGASKPEHIAIDILSSDEEHGDARPPVEPQRVDVDGIHVGSHVRVIDGDSPNLDDFGEVSAINNDESASIEVYLSHADNEEWFRPDQLELIREGGRKKHKKKRKTKKRRRNRKRRTKRRR